MPKRQVQVYNEQVARSIPLAGTGALGTKVTSWERAREAFALVVVGLAVLGLVGQPGRPGTPRRAVAARRLPIQAAAAPCVQMNRWRYAPVVAVDLAFAGLADSVHGVRRTVADRWNEMFRHVRRIGRVKCGSQSSIRLRCTATHGR
jgi:hypothetical protein